MAAARMGPRNHLLDDGVQIPMGRGNFNGETKRRPAVKYSDTLL